MKGFTDDESSKTNNDGTGGYQTGKLERDPGATIAHFKKPMGTQHSVERCADTHDMTTTRSLAVKDSLGRSSQQIWFAHLYSAFHALSQDISLWPKFCGRLKAFSDRSH